MKEGAQVKSRRDFDRARRYATAADWQLHLLSRIDRDMPLNGAEGEC